MSKNLRATSFKLPIDIEKKMLKKIIDDGYGMRGKSKWIINNIIKLLEDPDCVEMVSIAEDMDNLVRPISLRIPPELMFNLEKAVIKVRKTHPAMEGVKSNIIRASIMQGLIR